MSNKIAIVVGHSQRKQGAYSTFLNISEWDYHSEVVKHLNQVDVYYRNPELSNIKGIYDVVKRLNKKRYDLVLSLHFNAFNARAKGCEVLYYHKNRWTAQVAANFVDLIHDKYGIDKRPIKGVYSRRQNGGPLILGSQNDTIILEPFFGDHQEALKFKNPKRYAEVLNEFISCL